jgi:1-acyl-sn-glycerol-3-phosphate acyltransferase
VEKSDLREDFYLYGPKSLLQRFGWRMLKLLGWTASSREPPEPRGIIIVYPHTSNWDFVYGVLFKFAAAMQGRFLAKESLFRSPLGLMFRKLGGIPVDRRSPQGFISRLLEEFKSQSSMWLVITVEGTRAYTDHWKSGFYQIAVASHLPVALGYIDYGSRSVGVDTYVYMTGDRDKDMQLIRDFYQDKQGRRPELAGDIRLREKKDASAAP